MQKSKFEEHLVLSIDEQKYIRGGLLPGGGGGSCAGEGPSKSIAYCDSEGLTSVCCHGISGTGIDFVKAECIQSDGKTKATQYCVIA